MLKSQPRLAWGAGVQAIGSRSPMVSHPEKISQNIKKLLTRFRNGTNFACKYAKFSRGETHSETAGPITRNQFLPYCVYVDMNEELKDSVLPLCTLRSEAVFCS